MTSETPAQQSDTPAAEPSPDRLAEQPAPSLLYEFLLFLRQEKKWWLLPIVVVLLLASLIVAAGSGAAAPWIYTLF